MSYREKRFQYDSGEKICDKFISGTGKGVDINIGVYSLKNL